VAVRVRAVAVSAGAAVAHAVTRWSAAVAERVRYRVGSALQNGVREIYDAWHAYVTEFEASGIARQEKDILMETLGRVIVDLATTRTSV